MGTRESPQNIKGENALSVPSWNEVFPEQNESKKKKKKDFFFLKDET